MKGKQVKYIKSINLLIIGFIFILLFTLPVLFTRINGEIAWRYVFKIWKDQVMLIPLFAINHWILVPRLMLRRKYWLYVTSVLGIIAIFSASYYYNDEVVNKKPQKTADTRDARPDPVPPFANLLMYSLLIAGVDSGLCFSKQWHENEEKKQLLEIENNKMQLDILRNQISPHFFMNTLNNIYALVDYNSQVAKESVMKLSKMMRYLLYENENGTVKLSKEFEFIKSYIDLMKMRSEENTSILLIIPESYEDKRIPALLFLSYIENAFKYGISCQTPSFINIVFEISAGSLVFNCINSINSGYEKDNKGGLGLKNNKNRLDILFGKDYSLDIKASEKVHSVSLSIPLS